MIYNFNSMYRNHIFYKDDFGNGCWYAIKLGNNKNQNSMFIV